MRHGRGSVRLFGDRSKATRKLERNLRENRPSPPNDLVERMVAHVGRSSAAARSSRPRLLAAGLVAAVSLLAFAAFGGVGYAKSSATDAVSHTSQSISKFVGADSSNESHANKGKNEGEKSNSEAGKGHEKGNGDDENGDDDPGDDEYTEKVLICHGAPPHKPKKFITLKLSAQGAAAHLRNHPFDYAGPCKTT
jgi:hypothetical protein